MSLKPRIGITYSPGYDPAWLTNIIPHADLFYAVVVTGAESGPGLTKDDALAETCRKLRAAGVKVFGYIYTGQNIKLRTPQAEVVYGTRPLPELTGDMFLWNQWYGVPLWVGGPPLMDGFFADETASHVRSLEYYRDLIDVIHGTQGVILNFGVIPDQQFATLRATLCIAETSQGKYLAQPSRPDWIMALPPEQRFEIIYAVRDAQAVLARVRANGSPFYCITSAGADGGDPEFSAGAELFPETAPAPTPTQPTPTPPSTASTIASLQARIETLQNELARATMVWQAISTAVRNTGNLGETLAKVQAVVAELDNLKARVPGNLAAIPKTELLWEVARRMNS